jgi:hypothetical protein
MNDVISQYILRNKYKKVLIWYYFNRNIKRFKTLLEWVNNLIKLKKKLIYKIRIKDIKIPQIMNYYKDVRRGLNFFFGRSYNYKLFQKSDESSDDNVFLDFFYNINKILLYNRFKVLNYKNLSYKYRLKFKRYRLLNKIEGISFFKSFLNNFIKLSNSSNRVKRIRIKKRMKIARRQISVNFKSFFRFIFFFYLNKFNIIIDSYNKRKFNLFYLIKICKNYKSKKLKYRNRIIKKYKYDYVFRYKSKKIFKKKKLKKYGYAYNFINQVKKNNMNFLFFYWKYFIIFLGLKLRSKFKYRDFYKTNNILKLKKKV